MKKQQGGVSGNGGVDAPIWRGICTRDADRELYREKELARRAHRDALSHKRGFYADEESSWEK